MDVLLGQLVQPFPQTQEIITDIQDLCQKSEKLPHDFGDIPNNIDNCWSECEDLINHINKLEKAQKLFTNVRTSSVATVTIGTRCPQNNVTNVLNRTDIEELTKKLSNFIKQTPSLRVTVERTTKKMSHNFEGRARAFTVNTTNSAHLESKYNLNQLKAMETKEDDRKKHLSLRLDKLVDHSPQEKLLQVFTKTNRRRNTSNPWQQYISLVSIESKSLTGQSNNQSAAKRKSFRYGDRNTMNMFLQKRKSKVPATLSKEELHSFFQSANSGTTNDNKSNIVFGSDQIQKSAPRTVEFKRKQLNQTFPLHSAPVLKRISERTDILSYSDDSVMSEKKQEQTKKKVISPREQMLKSIAVKHKDLSSLNNDSDISKSPKESTWNESRSSKPWFIKEPCELMGTLRRRAFQEKEIKSRDKVK